MNKVFTLALIFFSLVSQSQDVIIRNLRKESERKISDESTDTSQKAWKKGGLYNLSLAQTTLNNWAAGGEDFSLAVNSQLSLFAFYKKNKHRWDNTFDFNLGYIRTTSLGGRKNDDRFDLLSKYGYAIGKKLDFGGIFNLRSQLFKGYRFTDVSKTKSSGFMAPGYLLLGLGLDYRPAKNLSLFISPLTARVVIVKDTALGKYYKINPGKKASFEFGAYATLNYLKQFNKNVTYKARLDLYSNYRHNPENIDVFFTNMLSAKISKVLALTYSLDLIYDDDVRLFGPTKTSPGLQVRSVVGVGLLLKF